MPNRNALIIGFKFIISTACIVYTKGFKFEFLNNSKINYAENIQPDCPKWK